MYKILIVYMWIMWKQQLHAIETASGKQTAIEHWDLSPKIYHEMMVIEMAEMAMTMSQNKHRP